MAFNAKKKTMRKNTKRNVDVDEDDSGDGRRAM